MSDLARRLSAANDVFDEARRLLASEPYDVGQANTAADLERLAVLLHRVATRAEARS